MNGLSFYEKVVDLREKMKFLENREVQLIIYGEDIFMELDYREGFELNFDGLYAVDSCDTTVDEYNENEYESLYIESHRRASEVSTFYIPLYVTFTATSEIEEMKKFENFEYINSELPTEAAFLIHQDTTDYIFYFK